MASSYGSNIRNLIENMIVHVEELLQEHETELEDPIVIQKLIRLVPHVELKKLEDDKFQHLIDFIVSEFQYLSAGRFRQLAENCYRSFCDKFGKLDLQFAGHFFKAFHFFLDDLLERSLTELSMDPWRIDQSVKKYGRLYVFKTLRNTLWEIFHDRKSKKDETWYMKVCGTCNPRKDDPFNNRCSIRCPKNAYSKELKKELKKEADTIVKQILAEYSAFRNETIFKAIGILFKEPTQWSEAMYQDIYSIFDSLEYITYLANECEQAATVIEFLELFYKREIRRSKKCDVLLTKIPRFKEKYQLNVSFYDKRESLQNIQDLVVDEIRYFYDYLDPRWGRGRWEVIINQYLMKYRSREYCFYLVFGFLLRNIAFAHHKKYSVSKKEVNFIQKTVDIMLRSLAAITEFALIYIKNFNLI